MGRSRARPRACPRARCFASCFWAPGAGADCVQVSFGNHVALLLSCWKKQKKFVIRKRPGGVFAATVTERDRAVWSPSPARAVASRRPGGSARCLGSRSAPPGLCACVALLGSEPSEPSSSGRKAGRWRRGGAQHGQRPLWAGPWCWGALRVSTTEAQRGGRAPSLRHQLLGWGSRAPDPKPGALPLPSIPVGGGQQGLP